MHVALPSHLDSYTRGVRQVEAHGSTLAEVLADLERRFPGLRFRLIDEQDRLRPHIKLFVGSSMARTLDEPVGVNDTVTIVAALSGG